MLQKSRTIGFYELEFNKILENGTGILDNAVQAFVNIKDFINSASLENKCQKIDEEKRCYIKSIEDAGLYTYKILFIKTGNHNRPKLLNINDYTERENPKTINEGDQIKTHLTLKFYPTQTHKAVVVLEESFIGSSILQFLDYLIYIARSKEATGIKTLFKIIHHAYTSENYLEDIKNNLKNVKVADIYYNKTMLGSEILGFSGVENDEIHNEIIVTIKAKRNGNFLDQAIENVEKFMTNTDIKCSKMKIKGFDHLGKERSFITDRNRKSKKANVDIDSATNEVKTSDMFRILLEEIKEFTQ